MGFGKTASLAVAMLFGLLAAAGPAAAATVNSGWGSYGPHMGITYQNRASVTNNSIMTTYISIKANKTIPAGYSGGQGSLYRNGALCVSASLYYKPTSTSSGGWSGGTAVKNCGGGNYTSRGSTAAYNGNGYNYYYTFTSQILQY